MRFIVSILSDQLIPNLLFIKQIAKEDDFHVFLTTEKMGTKNKTEILVDTLALRPEQYLSLKIDSDNPSLILEQLQSFNWTLSNQYVVNITGGTKIMSQMVFSFFKNIALSEIYYRPLGHSYLEKLHPILERIDTDAIIDLGLEEYLSAHGYTFEGNTKLSSKISRAEDLYSQICAKGDSALVKLIANAQQQGYFKLDKPYLTGGWFEEWLYYKVKETLKLEDDQIAYNLKLKSRFSNRQTDSDNEIDVAFVYKNNLYIIECKVYSKKQLDGNKITNAIYKISSLRHSMGLKATAVVAIMSDFGSSKGRRDTINYLCQMTGVYKVLSLLEMQSEEGIIREIKKLVNYE